MRQFSPVDRECTTAPRNARMPELVVGRQIVPNFSTIPDGEEKSFYVKKLHEMLQLTRSPVFPGSNPVGLTRKTIHLLSEHPYLVTLKSDGVRHLLLLTVRPDSTQADPAAVALMIDRALNMYEVDVCGSEEYFTRGTVLDGELVLAQPNEDKLLFLVFDVLHVKGERLCEAPFHERMERVRKCVLDRLVGADVEEVVEETDTIAFIANVPDIVMRPKTFVESMHAPWLWQDRHTSDHRVDGLILQREDAPYNPGAALCGSQLKWKVVPTVDLAGVPPNLRVRDNDAIIRKSAGHTLVVDETSEVVASDERDVIEYSMSKQPDDSVRLFALRRRPDKKHPNSKHVVEDTLRECLEAIQVDELAA